MPGAFLIQAADYTRNGQPLYDTLWERGRSNHGPGRTRAVRWPRGSGPAAWRASHHPSPAAQTELRIKKFFCRRTDKKPRLRQNILVSRNTPHQNNGPPSEGKTVSCVFLAHSPDSAFFCSGLQRSFSSHTGRPLSNLSHGNRGRSLLVWPPDGRPILNQGGPIRAVT